MKKIAIFCLILIFSILSFSCENYAEDGEVYFKPNYSGSKIEIDISSFNGSVIFRSTVAERTVMPEVLDGSNLNYYLYYINTLSSSSDVYTFYDKISLVYSSPQLATASVDFDSSVYRFALYATETEFDTNSSKPDIETVKNAACLVGYTMADLRTANKILFFLSENSLTTGGKVDITLNSTWRFNSDWENWISNGLAYVSIGLYDIITGELARTGGVNLNPHILSYNSEVSDFVHLSNYGFGDAEIAAGTYNLVVKFVNTNNGKVYEYSDAVIIMPNRISSETINVPDAIEKTPEPPSNFGVNYTSPINTKISSYLADFTWQDNSNNETGFEIEIADISCGHSNIDGVTPMIPNVVDDGSWELEVSKASYGSDNVTSYNFQNYTQYISHYYEYFGNDSAYDPQAYSLLRNNTKARFFLQLGKRYLARIRSVNEAGESAWVYRIVGSNECASVNLYRIIYYTDTNPVIEYHSQLENGIPIIASSSATWKKWHVSSLYDSLYPLQSDDSPCPYTGHENLTLVGEYEEVDDGSSVYDWQDGEVHVYGWAPFTSYDVYFSSYLSGRPGREDECENGQYLVISKADVTTLRWSLSESAWAKGYNSVLLTIKNTATDIDMIQTFDSATNIWTSSIGEWINGYYLATFTATTSIFSGHEFNFTVVLKLTD